MSAPMITLNLVPGANNIYRYIASWIPRGHVEIKLPSVEIHDVETTAELRPRTLKHLLKANHANFAIFFHDNEYHNHLGHILGSAYLLGANADQLHHVYNEESKQLVDWEDPPANIADSDWMEFLGHKEYQRAYVDFFEDELALKHSYDWTKVVDEYLFYGKKPLINCVISGLGHPLIHLGYAFELSSRELGMEAMAMIACGYNDLHKYIDDPSYTKKSQLTSMTPLELLHKMSNDERFDGVVTEPSGGECEMILDQKEDLILEYWNAWSLDIDPIKAFQASQEAAVALVVATVQPGTHEYDFFLVHILTTSHAVRILLPMIPVKFHVSVVRQWWLLTIMTYVGQMRPKIHEELIGRPDLKGRHWSYVEDKAVNGRWATDAHFVKGIRALREAAMTWGDVHEWYLTAAIKLADEFEGWTGFGKGA